VRLDRLADTIVANWFAALEKISDLLMASTDRTRILTAEAHPNLLAGRRVAVLGVGAQGHAHALNLRDSGVDVVVAQRPGSSTYRNALSAGFSPISISQAVQQADLLVFGLPDESAPEIYREQISAHLRPNQALGFIHGYNIHYGHIVPPPHVDVVLVAPKGQGRAVRNEFLAGRGVAALVAVHQDATGRALKTALGWAAALGCHRSVILTTTFAHETETDLFGEQAVLCGGLTALIRAGFDTLVEAGYPPELAYFECCHEVKLIADLVYEHGITGMRERISNTARFGDLTRGPRVISPAVREAMRAILAEVRSGQFAREWAEETRRGKPDFRRLTEAERRHLIEDVGAKLRGLMWGQPRSEPQKESDA
jgi:ketol-acid reductoisomerase